MENPETMKDGIAAELERIFASAGFSKNERLRKFLQFLVQQTLDGKADQLKETVIGSEVFGRKADYAPRTDPVVRMEAAKLRARLAEYYAGVGVTDPLRIEVPKGAYVPQWHANGVAGKRFPLIPVLASAAVLCLAVAGFIGWRRARTAQASERNAAAFSLYLKGRAVLDDRAERASQALQYFEQAIEKSPDYAPAFAGTAEALLRLDEEHRLERQQALDRASAAAEKALQLNPTLAEGFVEMGVVRVREYRWQEAERLFRRAVELSPENLQAHSQLAIWLLLPERRWDEAIRELRRAVAIDPLSSQANTDLAYGLLWSSRFAEAEEQARRAATLDRPQAEPYIILGQALYWQGRNADALAALQHAYPLASSGGADAWLACGQIRAGHREEALRLLKDNLPGGLRSKVPERRLLSFYACLGDKDRAFEAMDKMYANGEPHLPIFLLYREMDGLRSDSRFTAMLTKTGLAGSQTTMAVSGHLLSR